MVSSFPRWNDDRLDEMSRKLGRMDDVVTDVAVIKNEMRNLTYAVKANTTATEHVSDQFEKAQLEPLQRRRNIWTQLLIGLAGVVTAGGFSVLGAVIASSH